MNIPIYRANIENSNKYITGNLRKILTADSDVIMIEGLENLARIGINQGLYKIDETTLSIHFPDMLDSEGNKIFASLSEDGKGGDIIRCDEYFGVAKYIDCGFMVEYENCIESIFEQNFEVIEEIK